MATIWYVMDPVEPFFKRAFMHCLLKKFSDEEDHRYAILELDDVKDVGRDAQKRSGGYQGSGPDMVLVSSSSVASDRRFNLPEPRVPVFDLEWTLNHDNIERFVLGTDSIGFGLDKDGNFLGHGFSFGWRNISDARTWLSGHMPDPSGNLKGHKSGGSAQTPPTGHLGGKVASPSDSGVNTEFVEAVACYIVGSFVGAEATYGTGNLGTGLVTKETVSAICRVVVDAVAQGIQDIINSPPPKRDAGVVDEKKKDAGAAPPPAPKPPTPKPPAPKPPAPTSGGQSEPDDESGYDFLLLLREFVAQAMFEKERALGGLGKPEKSDVKIEFTEWLRENSIVVPPEEGFHDENDETGYEFLYFVFRRSQEMVTESHLSLKYKWHGGAPIDPITYVRRLAVRSMIQSNYLMGKVARDGTVELESHIVPIGPAGLGEHVGVISGASDGHIG